MEAFRPRSLPDGEPGGSLFSAQSLIRSRRFLRTTEGGSRQCSRVTTPSSGVSYGKGEGMDPTGARQAAGGGPLLRSPTCTTPGSGERLGAAGMIALRAGGLVLLSQAADVDAEL